MIQKIKCITYFLYGIVASLLTFLSLIIYKLAEWVLDTWACCQ